MGEDVKYSRVVPNSHFWTELEQLLTFMELQDVSRDYLLSGLENTIENGYKLTQVRQVTAVTTPYFLNLHIMYDYVKKVYNKGVFLKMLKIE